jgi:hypothetical protein
LPKLRTPELKKTLDVKQCFRLTLIESNIGLVIYYNHTTTQSTHNITLDHFTTVNRDITMVPFKDSKTTNAWFQEPTIARNESSLLNQRVSSPHFYLISTFYTMRASTNKTHNGLPSTFDNTTQSTGLIVFRFDLNNSNLPHFPDATSPTEPEIINDDNLQGVLFLDFDGIADTEATLAINESSLLVDDYDVPSTSDTLDLLQSTHDFPDEIEQTPYELERFVRDNFLEPSMDGQLVDTAEGWHNPGNTEMARAFDQAYWQSEFEISESQQAAAEDVGANGAPYLFTELSTADVSYTALYFGEFEAFFNQNNAPRNFSDERDSYELEPVGFEIFGNAELPVDYDRGWAWGPRLRSQSGEVGGTKSDEYDINVPERDDEGGEGGSEDTEI